MRGGLPQKEPAILKTWEDGALYRTLREHRHRASWSPSCSACYCTTVRPTPTSAIHIGHAR